MLLSASVTLAFDASRYAVSSVLAEGKWARVKVESTGMHVVTDAQLRSLGFTDPSRVHVYGTGGRMVPEYFSDNMPDDLPLLPSVRTAKGIVFFAVDWFSWNPVDTGNVHYEHTINPYSEQSFYYLSDREVDEKTMQSVCSPGAGGLSVRSDFRERLVHEQDLQNPGESGRLLLGEDFRTQKSQKFTFQLPDNVDGDAVVSVRFGAKVTNGSSSLMFTANGRKLPSTASDVIAKVSDAERYCNLEVMTKTAEGVGDKLEFGIDYSYSGALFTARLDYIDVFYNRSLRMRDGSLYFYHLFSEPEAVSVEGCSASTVIWDVTEEWNPKKVEFSLSGSRAVFAVTQAGYREFIAFDPEKVSASVTPAGSVQNQDIHALDTPDMLIISPAEYIEGARRIASLHETHDGMLVHVLTPEEIYHEFSGGTPDVSAFRKLLKMWYDRPGERQIGYCLIMGKPTFDIKGRSTEVRNLNYVPVPIWQSPVERNSTNLKFSIGLDETESYSNDDYIGMLDDQAMARTDMSRALLDVVVGRLPVRNARESLDMAAKIEKYVLSPNYGAWRNKVMIIADDGNSAAHLIQAEDVHRAMRSAGNGAAFLYDRIYLDTFELKYTGIGATYPAATKKMMSNYNEGVVLTNYIGHANPTSWGHEHLWDWESITSMTNPNLTFMYAATCGFAYWDRPDLSGGEVIVLNPDAGVIGMMAATRTVYINYNGDLNKSISKYFFARDKDGLPLRLGDIYAKGKSDFKGDRNKLRYAFVGDPALRLGSPVNDVVVTSVNGQDVTDRNVPYPEVPARGELRIEGYVAGDNGSVHEDFTGTVNILLYDAERVIETNGFQGVTGRPTEGVVVMYNDRTVKLAEVNGKVEKGRFNIVVKMPSEIENLYVPARFTAYAWDGNGLEANGEFDRFYVYGYSEDAAADDEGPQVEYLYLNNRNFNPGDVVNSNPVLFARVSDPSGINLSNAGIGHKITAVVDGSTIYDDVSSFFTSDPEEEGAGTVSYPISGLAPGKHELVFTVWDNANNSSSAALEFNVGAAVDPVIHELATNVNPASSDVTFRLSLDRPNTRMQCTLGVFDLTGRKVWEYTSQVQTDIESTMRCTWDLRDGSGTRVPRGIYLYRATVETPEGTYTSKTERLAVTAQ